MTQKPIVVCQMDIPHGSMVGSKGPIVFMVRYWFGPGDTIYVETIGSDGKSYGFEEEKG